MADEVQIVISARDEASRVIGNVKNQLELFGQVGPAVSNLEQPIQRATAAAGGLDLSVSKLTRGVRGLAVPLISELSPALGTTASHMGGVVASSLVLGGGLVTLGLAAASLAGIVAGRFVESWRRGREEIEQFNRALRSGDLGLVTGQISKQSDELDKLRSRLAAINAEIARIDPRTLAQLQGPLSPTSRRRGAEAEAAQIEDRIRELREQEAGIETGRTVAQAFEAGQKIDEGRAKQALGLLDRINSGEFSAQFILDPIERQAALSRIARAPQVTLLRESGLTGAAGFLESLTGRERSLALGQRAIARGVALAAGEPDLSAIPRIFGTEQDVALSQQRVARGLDVAAGEEDLSRVPRIFGTEQDAALAAKAEADRLQLLDRDRLANLGLLDVTRQRAEVLGQLTPEINAQLILDERGLLLARDKLTEREQQLINAKAEVAVLEQMAALDPLVGLAAGFSRVATDSRKLGTELERFADETAGNMSRSFSDQFFNLFTGRKGQDLGRQFGDAMLRSFTDVLGRQLSGAVSGLFSRALGGFGAFLPGGAGGGGGFDLLSVLGFGGGGGGGPILSSTGAPAGGLVMTQAGLGQVLPSGAVKLVSGGAGGGVGDFSSFLPSPSTLQTGFNLVTGRGPSVFDFGTAFASGGANAIAALNAGQAVVSGGQFISNAGELAAAGISSPGVAGASSAGLTGAAAASGVLAGIALGFTIFSGLQGAPTAMNIAIGTVSGGLSGAILGGAIGGIAGGPAGALVGGVIGAIAGGLLGGGSAALGKGGQGKKISAGERSAQIGAASAANLSSALDSAASIEDLVAIFNRQWAPHGEVQIVTDYQGVRYWAGDFDDPPGALATVELMIIPEFLDALEIQVGQTGAPARRQDLIDKFRAKRDEILETLSNIPFGILESDRAAGLTRRTYAPFQTLYGLEKGTRQLFGSSEFYRQDLGGSDETIAWIMDRLREYSVRRDVDLNRQDFLFRT